MKKPEIKDFKTNDGLHQAMLEYAHSFDKKSLRVAVEFNDSSKTDNFHTFQRAKTVSGNYKDFDGETWEIIVDSTKFEPDFLPDYDDPLSVKELKTAVIKWLGSEVKTVKFIYLEE